MWNNEPMHKHRILLVEDHPIVREGMKRLLSHESDIKVCGEADSRRSALECLLWCKPDLVLLDLGLKDSDGLDLLKIIHSSHPELPVLVISMYDESVYSERVLQAGARGYIMKQEAASQVLTAVREVLRGNIYLGSQASQCILQEVTDSSGETNSRGVDSLSDRELQVFQMIGRGMGPSRIAKALSLSVKTVETHMAHAKNKMGFERVEELRRAAIEWGRR